jgi:hypothetical protein
METIIHDVPLYVRFSETKNYNTVFLMEDHKFMIIHLTKDNMYY